MSQETKEIKEKRLFKVAKWRELRLVDLQLELQELSKQQFKLKMQQSIGELKATHQLRVIRRDIARVLGLAAEKAC